MIVAGGFVYTGTKPQIEKLLIYMGDSGYDTESIAFDNDPWKVSREMVKRLSS